MERLAITQSLQWEDYNLSPAETIGNGSIISHVVRDMIIWIDENITEDLHVHEVARRAGYTRWHFQRKFREITGVALSSFIRQRRFNKAADLIISTEINFLDIAEMCGITSQQQLCRGFRQQFKTSPAKMRELARTGCYD